MTIHSDWARLLHDECPDAFHERIPKAVRFDVGVIDGHLQLMSLNSNFSSWEQFLLAVFVRPIQRLFDAGAPIVVLCFDAYDQVPAYKSMTQLKRCSRIAPCVSFTADEALPEEIPEATMEHLMNRSFKLKVVQLALQQVPRMLQTTLASAPERRLVLDYKSTVEYSGRTGMVPRRLDDMVPMGESDVKYVRYVERYGNALVHAVDGDYMAIALLYYARGGVRDDNRIFVFRQRSTLHPTKKDTKKRNREEEEEVEESGDDDLPRSSSTSTTTTTTTTAHHHSSSSSNNKNKNTRKINKKRASPPKCWVDMQLLFVTIAESMRQSGVNDTSENATVQAAVLLMLCAGTDFSRPLPLLGPKRLWEYLPMVANDLVRGVPLLLGEETPLELSTLCDSVVGAIYRLVFSNHVPVSVPKTLSDVLKHLKHHSRLADITRSRLPSEAQVRVTLQNVGWVMAYWTAINRAVPTPLDGSQGFVLCPVSQRITFADRVSS